MKTSFLAGAVIALFSSVLAVAAPEMTVKKLSYEHAGDVYAPVLVGPKGAGALPGVLMVPNWMGVTDAAVAKASRVAALGYTVYVADVYTAAVRPKDGNEAGAVAGSLRADRGLMRARAQAAFAHFKSLAGETRVPGDDYAAIGFCFGGGTVLELARTGAPLKAYVSFHGDLVSPTLERDSAAIKGRVLVLHGAADPLVTPEHVNAWQAAMGATKVDWQFVAYGGAVHSFTDPTASMKGVAEYDAVTAARAFAAMDAALKDVFAGAKAE